MISVKYVETCRSDEGQCCQEDARGASECAVAPVIKSAQAPLSRLVVVPAIDNQRKGKRRQRQSVVFEQRGRNKYRFSIRESGLKIAKVIRQLTRIFVIFFLENICEK